MTHNVEIREGKGMSSEAQQQRDTKVWREAEEARNKLAKALAAAGITLPSLRIDPGSCTGSGARPLIELGRCSLDMARDLAAAVAGGQEQANGD